MEFPNILVIKVADAENYQGAVSTFANFGYARKHGNEALHERYNLLRLPKGQENSGQYGVYFPNEPFVEKWVGKGWLVFMVSTPKEGGRTLISWFEEAELLGSFSKRTDEVVPSKEGESYPNYQILAKKAYAFRVRPLIETLGKIPGKKRGIGSAATLFLRQNGEELKPYSLEVIKELLSVRKKALETGAAVSPERLDFAEDWLDSEGFKTDEGSVEGKKRRFSHLGREHSPILRRKFLAFFEKRNGSLYCEKCKFPKKAIFEEGEKILEVHHKIPLSSLEDIRETKLEDLALLCPNCHRAIHRELIPNIT